MPGIPAPILPVSLMPIPPGVRTGSAFRISLATDRFTLSATPSTFRPGGPWPPVPVVTSSVTLIFERSFLKVFHHACLRSCPRFPANDEAPEVCCVAGHRIRRLSLLALAGRLFKEHCKARCNLQRLDSH